MTPGATNILDLDYTYGTTANNGNVMSQTIDVPSVGQTNGFTAVQNYNYDSPNRLKDATENDPGSKVDNLFTWSVVTGRIKRAVSNIVRGYVR